LWVNTQDFRIILDNNRDLYKDFTNYLTKLVNSSYSLSNKLAHECVKIRIASLLMELLAKFSGKNKKNNSSKIIKITRNQIAEATGTTPETAIRVTREMHKDGIIDCGKPGIIRILNIEELKNFR